MPLAGFYYGALFVTGFPDNTYPLLIRLLASLWWRLTRGMTLSVRAVVRNDQGHVLLVRHRWMRGWHLPGGGVKNGETLVTALTRELAEEAHLRLEAPPCLHGLYANPAMAPFDHVALFVVDAYTITGPRKPDIEIAAITFWPIEALPPETTTATLACLAEIDQGQPPRLIW